LTTALIEFESQTLHSTEVYNKVSDVYFWLTAQYDQHNNVEDNSIGSRLFRKAGNKLKKYFIDGEQTGMDLFRTAQIFHPIKFKEMSSDLKNYPILKTQLTETLIKEIQNEWPVYIAACNSTVLDNFKLIEWWSNNKERFPKIFSVANW